MNTFGWSCNIFVVALLWMVAGCNPGQDRPAIITAEIAAKEGQLIDAKAKLREKDEEFPAWFYSFDDDGSVSFSLASAQQKVRELQEGSATPAQLTEAQEEVTRLEAIFKQVEVLRGKYKVNSNEVVQLKMEIAALEAEIELLKLELDKLKPPPTTIGE